MYLLFWLYIVYSSRSVFDTVVGILLRSRYLIVVRSP